MLTPHTKTPEVSQTTMSTNLLQPFEILSNLRVNSVRKNLRVLPIDNISLPVQKPEWDLELGRILNDGDNTFELVRVEFPSSRRNSKRAIIASGEKQAHLLLRSTSAFLQTKLE